MSARPTAKSMSVAMSLLPVIWLAAFAAEQSPIVVDGPAIIAFFPVIKPKPVREPDANESLADFQLYANSARQDLELAGIALHEIYSGSFQIREGERVTTFRPPRNNQVGYYLIAPGKAPRVEYGVLTDSDLLQSARRYFGPTGGKRH